MARDGEALIRIIRDRKLPYGIALQLLEADRLDDSINQRLNNGNIIRQGVECDSLLRVIAYHIRAAHPGENYQTTVNLVERVPARDLIHLFLPERAEQVRGYTWLHAIILRGSIIHKFEDAAVIAAQIGASKVAALERAEEAPDAISTLADGVSGGMPQIKVEAGELFELPPGYKLNSWNPEYPHANFESFLKACLRGLAAGLDVAAHNLTGDMTDVNYSSARIAELSERESWMVLQDWLISSLLIPVLRGLAGFFAALRPDHVRGLGKCPAGRQIRQIRLGLALSGPALELGRSAQGCRSQRTPAGQPAHQPHAPDRRTGPRIRRHPRRAGAGITGHQRRRTRPGRATGQNSLLRTDRPGQRRMRNFCLNLQKNSPHLRNDRKNHASSLPPHPENRLARRHRRRNIDGHQLGAAPTSGAGARKSCRTIPKPSICRGWPTIRTRCCSITARTIRSACCSIPRSEPTRCCAARPNSRARPKRSRSCRTCRTASAAWSPSATRSTS